MYLRISSLLAASALLAACGPETPAPEGTAVICAIGPGSDYAEVCTLERVDPVEFIIHHPDGGFRRFVWADTGALTAADGAEPLDYQESVDQTGMIEFGMQNERYRLERSLVEPSAGE